MKKFMTVTLVVAYSPFILIGFIGGLIYIFTTSGVEMAHDHLNWLSERDK